ncbi:MAG: hypothetical protein QOJ19_1822 [Acidimicrobiia bacterium]|nr:hypothetical protein [Acidimicrobiia bacterium]
MKTAAERSHAEAAGMLEGMSDREKDRFHTRMLDAIGQAVVVTDPAGRVLEWNKAATAMYGWAAHEAAGLPISVLIPSDDLAGQAHDVRRRMQLGEVWSGDCSVQTRDHGTRRISMTLNPVADDTGRLSAVIAVSTEMSQGHRAEDVMREHSAIVESSADAILGKTLDGIIRSWNNAATALYGYEPEEVIGRHVSLICPPDRLEELNELLDRLRKNGQGTHIETTRRRKDGSLVEVSLTVSPIRDGEGDVVGASASARDISARKHIERAAAEDRLRLEEAQRIAELGSFEYDLHDGTLRRSKEQCRLLGTTESESQGLDAFLALVHPDDRQEVIAAMEAVCSLGTPVDDVHRVVRPDGELRWVHIRASRAPERPGAPSRVVGTMEDVTERKRVEIELREAETRVRLGFEYSAIGVAMIDLAGRLTMVNPAMCDLLARDEPGLLGREFRECVHPEDRWPDHPSMTELLAPEVDSLKSEMRLVRPDGQFLWALTNLSLVRKDDGEPAYVFAQVQDIADRKETEQALERLALHDQLTALPNRSLLTDRVHHAMERTRRHAAVVALLFLDLDRFKLINDSLGHGAGDQILVAVADRLRATLRPCDTIARFGGDEFVVVCEDLGDSSQAVVIGERLARALEPPFAVEGREVFVTASIGIAIVGEGDSAEDVIRKADAAMYRAKDRGRARVEVFDEALHQRAAERFETEMALRRALDRKEFRLTYQPVVRLVEPAVVGCEALLRWMHPDRGMVSPADFIPLAEDTGLIMPIGAWALRTALQQVQQWRSEIAGCERLWVAVNLSAVQLLAPNLVEVVAEGLRCSGIDPAAVHLEITESVVMRDVERSIETLVGLKNLGVGIAVDDFGTGYSSLSYLKRLPIDTLKIDRSFVDGLGTETNDSSIVSAIVSLGHALGLDLVAEGVETAKQLEALQDLECDLAQGYLWAKPVLPDEFLAAVRDVGELLEASAAPTAPLLHGGPVSSSMPSAHA